MKIYVLHENPAWVEPLRRAFAERSLPFEEWVLVDGAVDMAVAPPEGVFYNRMSASSHTRGHRYAPELTSAVLSWLEGHGRRVVNNGQALRLEVNKAAQYASLSRHGLAIPRTIAAVGREAIVEAAQAFAPGPVILKPNRGGRGQGVLYFDRAADLCDHILGDAFEAPIDGVSLVQEYIRAPQPIITRAEFIGGRFYYAVQVDTSGGFELCPADVCQIGEPGSAGGRGGRYPFTLIDTVDPALIRKYEAFLAASGIEIAGIEFISDAQGRVYTYDVNTNTNYNTDAEARANRSGMGEIARFLGEELARLGGASDDLGLPGAGWSPAKLAGWA